MVVMLELGHRYFSGISDDLSEKRKRAEIGTVTQDRQIPRADGENDAS